MGASGGKRMSGVTPFIVMDLVKDAQLYPDVVHFEIGQPDVPPSPGVVEALRRATDEGRFSYTESKGLLALRERIAGSYLERHGVSIDPGRILLTPGTSGAFLVAYSLALDPGERIVLTDPSYPCYKNFARVLDVEPLTVPIGPEDRWELSPGALARAAEVEGVVAVHVGSPSNPVGNVYRPETLEGLVETCREKGLAFVSDELYHGLEYGPGCRSALEFGDEVYVINGFSKYYCMPGFRLGWIVVPEDRAREAEVLAQNLFISAPTLSQHAALGAFDEKHLASVRNAFRERRDYLAGALSELFTVDAVPEGAFYIWVDAARHTDDALAFAGRMLKDIHVAVSPGVDFGSNGTRTRLRFSYTRDIGHMAEGVERMRRWLE